MPCTAREVVETVVVGGGSISRAEVETVVEGEGSMLCDAWEYDHRVVFPTITSQVTAILTTFVLVNPHSG